MARTKKLANRTAPQDWRDRISIDPKVCHGKPRIRGTRIMVSIILDYPISASPPTEDGLSGCEVAESRSLREGAPNNGWRIIS